MKGTGYDFCYIFRTVILIDETLQYLIIMFLCTIVCCIENKHLKAISVLK